MAKKIIFKESRPKGSMRVIKPGNAAKMRGIDKPSPRKVKHV